MSTKQASLNVLTDKVCSVRPWRSRFNLVSQGLTTFQVWRSCCPTLDGDISQWHPWGPISFGVCPNLLISCCTPAIPCFHLPNWMQLLMWCQGRLMGERLGNRAIWTSGCRIQAVSKVVRPCERPRNSRVWWSSNGEWQTNTCEFCSGIFQGYRNEAFQWVDGRRSHRTSHVSNYPLPVAMSTKQASLNCLTDKVPSVRPWRSRFNLVSQCLTTFHMWWSGFPPLHGNISWGPISFLESAQILWSHFAFQQYHGYLNILNGGETGQQGDLDFRL